MTRKTDGSGVLYLQGGTWTPTAEITVATGDPKLNIQFPPADNYIISDRDKNAISLDQAVEVRRKELQAKQQQ